MLAFKKSPLLTFFEIFFFSPILQIMLSELLFNGKIEPWTCTWLDNAWIRSGSTLALTSFSLLSSKPTLKTRFILASTCQGGGRQTPPPSSFICPLQSHFDANHGEIFRLLMNRKITDICKFFLSFNTILRVKSPDRVKKIARNFFVTKATAYKLYFIKAQKN